MLAVNERVYNLQPVEQRLRQQLQQCVPFQRDLAGTLVMPCLGISNRYVFFPAVTCGITLRADGLHMNEHDMGALVFCGGSTVAALDAEFPRLVVYRYESVPLLDGQRRGLRDTQAHVLHLATAKGASGTLALVARLLKRAQLSYDYYVLLYCAELQYCVPGTSTRRWVQVSNREFQQSIRLAYQYYKYDTETSFSVRVR